MITNYHLTRTKNARTAIYKLKLSSPPVIRIKSHLIACEPSELLNSARLKSSAHAQILIRFLLPRGNKTPQERRNVRRSTSRRNSMYTIHKQIIYRVNNGAESFPPGPGSHPWHWSREANELPDCE